MLDGGFTKENPLPSFTGEGGPKPEAWGVRVLLTQRYRPSPPTATRRAHDPPLRLRPGDEARRVILPRKAGEGLETGTLPFFLPKAPSCLGERAIPRRRGRCW